jgi:hypothetical protein
MALNKLLERSVWLVFDYAIALVTVLLSALLLWWIVPVYRMLYGWPIIFTQTRIGLNGEPFTIYKFRTLRSDGELLGWFAKLLRIAKIDELPQVLNIFRREMSVVGPRPLMPEEASVQPRARFARRPGLTSPILIGLKVLDHMFTTHHGLFYFLESVGVFVATPFAIAFGVTRKNHTQRVAEMEQVLMASLTPEGVLVP